jgi:hypothetical protein
MNKNPMYSFHGLTLLAVLLFSSCGTKTFTITINDIGSYPQPLVKPLPLKVGAYYRDDFAFGIIPEKMTNVSEIKIGKANIALFDYILSHAFEKVIPVQNLSENVKDKRNIDLIIEPTIHKYFFFKWVRIVKIIYTIAFYTPDGERLGQGIEPWQIEGYAYLPSSRVLFGNTLLAKGLTQMAMRQVAAIFLTGLCEQEEMKQFFYEQCNQ